MGKKLLLSACTICFLSMLTLPTMASAATTEGDDMSMSQSMMPGIIQHQWDGLCCFGAACTDNCFDRFGCCAYRDCDGDGVCNNAPGPTACPGFVDNDGDGVCDNRERLQNKQGSRPALGHGHGSSQGKGCGRLN